jgi:hypothetical protein
MTISILILLAKLVKIGKKTKQLYPFVQDVLSIMCYLFIYFIACI